MGTENMKLKPETVKKNLEVSKNERNNTIRMYRPIRGEESCIPSWCFKMNKKGMNDDTQNTVIIQQLQEVQFDKAEIIIISQLVHMICKWKWLTGDPYVTYKTAVYVLTVFSINHLADDLVTNTNENLVAISQATDVMAAEIKTANHTTVFVPENIHNFMELLKYV